jgi:HlyD family secretion protein
MAILAGRNTATELMARAGVAALAALLICGLAAPAGVLAATEGAKDPLASALSVSVKRARKMCFADKVEVTGTLAARREVDVGTSRDGLVVTQVLVEPLDAVAPGQVLAQLSAMDGSGAGIAVRSTVSGVVGRSFAVVGMPVSARQGPLFRIIAGGELDLRAEMPIDQLKKLVAGQQVTVKPLGQPETTDRVQFIAPSVDPASQLGRARIAVAAGRPMRVGAFARGIVDVVERCGAGIPYSAIMYEPDGAIVHVVADNRVVARKVDMGLMSGKNVEIRSGLTADDLVVMRAGPFLRDGDLVNAILIEEADRMP